MTFIFLNSADVSAVDETCEALALRERDVRIEHSLPNSTPAILQAARRATGAVLWCTLLWCTVLYCTVLYCTVLYCTVLYCTVLYCDVLYCTVLWCTLLWCTLLYCTALYCTVLHFTVLYCTVLYCTVLYCTVLCLSLRLQPRILTSTHQCVYLLIFLYILSHPKPPLSLTFTHINTRCYWHLCYHFFTSFSSTSHALLHHSHDLYCASGQIVIAACIDTSTHFFSSSYSPCELTVLIFDTHTNLSTYLFIHHTAYHMISSSLGSVAYAIDRVLCGKNRNAFCVVRPPGHHAGT